MKCKTFLLFLSTLAASNILYLNSVSQKINQVAKNIAEGRGFRLMGGDKKGGTFDFASSNELWRASLDTIEFMPLASASYSGGIIITDWFSDETHGYLNFWKVKHQK